VPDQGVSAFQYPNWVEQPVPGLLGLKEGAGMIEAPSDTTTNLLGSPEQLVVAHPDLVFAAAQKTLLGMTERLSLSGQLVL
jgi:light-regulated signal transduction histidine kinase (bacteriophytochrome)